MKSNEMGLWVKMKNTFEYKGEQIDMSSRKNYFMDTNIMLKVLHLPKTDIIEELSILQRG